ncbi:MAG: hypothetical protein D6675_06835 [Gemmatimonadetes bacterium]|nr:MAG: hypothetical protein D6675_06835 [Gemmatimonadota bacterium]
MSYKTLSLLTLTLVFFVAGSVFAADRPVGDLRECSGPNAFHGMVMTPDNDFGVPGVLLEFEGACSDQAESDADGSYVLDAAADGDYIITPSKFGDQGDAIGPFDAANAARFSAGLIDLDEYQQIAADVTGDGNITPFDAARILQFSVGILDEFPAGDWAFSPNEAIEVGLAGGEDREVNFVGILIGDVTLNWEPSGR